MTVADEIEARIRVACAPETLEVINESAAHHGHAGDDGSGESHFRVRIRAEQFADMSRIARHRSVHQAIGADLMTRIHALAIEIL